jgi:protoheme IX farnesyltransferase
MTVFFSILKLVRVNISLLVVSATYFGFVLTHRHFNKDACLILIAVLMHSFGNSIINQFQEIQVDAIMERTRNRPLPANRINKEKALIAGIILIAASIAIPIFLKNYFIVVLLLLNLVIYNFVYTPLKQKTSFALLIGSLCGAFPPIIGWMITGRRLEVEVIFVAAVFYMWQVPHFLFLTEKYKKEYKKAGVKILINEIPEESYNLISKMWLTGYFLLLEYTIFYLLDNNISFIILSIVETFLIGIILLIRHKPVYKFNLLNLTVVAFLGGYIINDFFI